MSEEANIVTITGSFDIAQITEAHTRLHNALTSHRQVVLDLSAVEGIDLAGLQLVCAVHRTAQEAGVSFHLSRPIPACIVDCARSAGFSCPGDTPCLWNEDASDLVWEGDNG
jgi:ABC-type transporter Mla MlaB component